MAIRTVLGMEYRLRALGAESCMAGFGQSEGWREREADAGYCLDAITDLPTGRTLLVDTEAAGRFAFQEAFPARF